ncbi:MAG: FHA domain-containing protein, partial [Planctomycetes bacterium]|nr:FHA domain-containing protein [Planctomycetota bacterium]
MRRGPPSRRRALPPCGPSFASRTTVLKLRILKPGQPPRELAFAADEAVVGRAPGCDVVLTEPYVSKRHVKVLAGVVVVDLGSSNGTHVNGVRLAEPVLLLTGEFKLGTEEGDVRVAVEHEPEGLLDQPAVVRVRQELEGERRRAAGLANELAALRASEQARAGAPQDGASDELRRELRDAKQRLESLRKEIEARDTAASEGIQARLAQDALLEVQRAKEALEREVNELRAATPAAALEAAKRALAARVAELEADDAELRERVRRLESELAAAKAPAEAGGNLSTLFFKLQAENRELRQKLEQKGSGGVES